MARLGLVVPFQHPVPLAEQLSLVKDAESRGDDSAWLFAKAGVTRPVVFPFSAEPDPNTALLRTVRAFPS